jgi:hypothetical protein
MPDISDPLAGFQRALQDMSGPRPDMPDPSFLTGFQRPNPDMSGPRPDMSGLSALSDLSALSGLAARFQRRWSDMSGPQPEHVQISETPMARFFCGAIKGPHASLARLATHFTLQIFWVTLFSSRLQASFKSKHHWRDLRLTLEWPTRSSSQALHRRSPCVHYSWQFVPLDGLGCPGVTKVVVDPEKFVLPSPLWEFDSENRTRSWWSFEVD